MRVVMQQTSDMIAVQASQDPDVIQQSQTTAAVPERTGPPDTVSSMKTGYIVALTIFLAYIVLLMRRVASVRKSS